MLHAATPQAGTPDRALPIAPGQLIGNYRVVRLLGSGGMGAVFAAEHCQIGRRAAIKVLFPHLAQDPQQASRFLTEARAVNLIGHPNLIEVYEMGTLPGGAAYIVMELLSGTSLRERMRFAGGRLGASTLRFARQIASALAAAHDKGIIHRDLKPDNVMIIGDPEVPAGERVKVLDFGIARIGAGPEEGEGMMGTPLYMSPEQCRGDGSVGPPTDVYALGVILYQLLAGAPPFRGPSLASIVSAHLLQEPRHLRLVDPDLPLHLSELVQCMLRKDPAHRPTMAAVATVLDQVFHAPLPPPQLVATTLTQRTWISIQPIGAELRVHGGSVLRLWALATPIVLLLLLALWLLGCTSSGR